MSHTYYTACMSTTAHTGYTNTDTSGAIAVIAGSAIWGIFWLPLRYLHDAGISGLWAVSLVTSAALLPALLAMWWQRETATLLRMDSWLVGLALGTSTVLYFTGVLYSDVIRVIFLFYLLPLWTTVADRLIYGLPIRRIQLIVIGVALAGVWLLLGGGTAIPVPRNIGDWCGIGAGLCWGVSLSLLRGRELTPPFASTLTAMAVAMILSACVALLAGLTVGPVATTDDLHSGAVSWMHTLTLGGLFGALILFPAMLGQIWGARRIPAPTAALLTMSEIIVATLSAGLLIGTDLQPASWLGGAIIIVAVCIDLSAQRSLS